MALFNPLQSERSPLCELFWGSCSKMKRPSKTCRNKPTRQRGACGAVPSDACGPAGDHFRPAGPQCVASDPPLTCASLSTHAESEACTQLSTGWVLLSHTAGKKCTERGIHRPETAASDWQKPLPHGTAGVGVGLAMAKWHQFSR